MEECVNDFIAKVGDYESDEELYEDLDLETPYPPTMAARSMIIL